ncbi:hypothetical protein PYCCODRAFT_822210 [Trametes coccinea BRFM310]|uniref:Uncharacterized protein n=1 Tax=Trametes coccinea (strain BRFM310) TaxID=1353009 RepID=A0A1Y2IH78_TRAC3|nr:hypothetical protein PYCCODRAFT_822210 [Trametes coccinea BRFM310]
MSPRLQRGGQQRTTFLSCITFGAAGLRSQWILLSSQDQERRRFAWQGEWSNRICPLHRLRDRRLHRLRRLRRLHRLHDRRLHCLRRLRRLRHLRPRRLPPPSVTAASTQAPTPYSTKGFPAEEDLRTTSSNQPSLYVAQTADIVRSRRQAEIAPARCGARCCSAADRHLPRVKEMRTFSETPERPTEFLHSVMHFDGHRQMIG